MGGNSGNSQDQQSETKREPTKIDAIRIAYYFLDEGNLDIY